MREPHDLFALGLHPRKDRLTELLRHLVIATQALQFRNH